MVEEAEQAVHEVQTADEPVTVVISRKGFLRARTGHGHDCSLMSFKTGDGLEATIECRSSSQISFLDQAGRVYTLAVSALPGLAAGSHNHRSGISCPPRQGACALLEGRTYCGAAP